MSDFIEKLFFNTMNNIIKSESVRRKKIEAENYRNCLEHNLNKKQRLLLLRFEDEKDLIKEITATESFSAGFKLGLKIGYEANKQ